MTIAGISQPTWKWTPSLWISDHWLMTVRTRKPKMTTARPICRASRTRRLRGGLVPNRAPASPIRCRSGWLRSTCISTLMTHRASTGCGPPQRARRSRFGIVSRWASSSCWRSCASACPRPVRGSCWAAATTPRSPCPAAPPRPRSTRSSTASTSAATRPSSSQIGHKALATALSDLAAMGAEAARPTWSSAPRPSSARPSCWSCSTGCSRSPPGPGRRSPAATSPERRR